eukprot:CFRG2900T1
MDEMTNRNGVTPPIHTEQDAGQAYLNRRHGRGKRHNAFRDQSKPLTMNTSSTFQSFQPQQYGSSGDPSMSSLSHLSKGYQPQPNSGFDVPPRHPTEGEHVNVCAPETNIYSQTFAGPSSTQQQPSQAGCSFPVFSHNQDTNPDAQNNMTYNHNLYHNLYQHNSASQGSQNPNLGLYNSVSSANVDSPSQMHPHGPIMPPLNTGEKLQGMLPSASLSLQQSFVTPRKAGGMTIDQEESSAGEFPYSNRVKTHNNMNAVGSSNMSMPKFTYENQTHQHPRPTQYPSLTGQTSNGAIGKSLDSVSESMDDIVRGGEQFRKQEAVDAYPRTPSQTHSFDQTMTPIGVPVSRHSSASADDNVNTYPNSRGGQPLPPFASASNPILLEGGPPSKQLLHTTPGASRQQPTHGHSGPLLPPSQPQTFAPNNESLHPPFPGSIGISTQSGYLTPSQGGARSETWANTGHTYHQGGMSNTQTQGQQQLVQDTPLLGRPPLRFVVMGFGGRVVKVSHTTDEYGNSKPKAVQVYNLSTMLKDTIHYNELKCFPGPLNKATKREVSQAIEQRINENDSDRDIWTFMEIASKQGGLLPKNRENSEGVKPYLTLLPGGSTTCNEHQQQQGQFYSHGAETQIQEHLLQGKAAEAIEMAGQQRQWLHALALASHISAGAFHKTLNDYVINELAPTSPMRTLYNMYCNVPPAFLSTANLDAWGDHVKILLLNSNGMEANQHVCSIGDALRNAGRVREAHICYLLAGVPVRSLAKQSRIVLLGGDHQTQSFRSLIALRRIQLTETYEWVQTLCNSQYTLPSLAPFKLLYAFWLAEVGLMEEASEYCESIVLSVKSSGTGNGAYSRSFLQRLQSLSERIKIHNPAVSGSTNASKIIGRLFGGVGDALSSLIKTSPSADAKRSQPKPKTDSTPGQHTRTTSSGTSFPWMPNQEQKPHQSSSQPPYLFQHTSTTEYSAQHTQPQHKQHPATLHTPRINENGPFSETRMLGSGAEKMQGIGSLPQGPPSHTRSQSASYQSLPYNTLTHPQPLIHSKQGVEPNINTTANTQQQHLFALQQTHSPGAILITPTDNESSRRIDVGASQVMPSQSFQSQQNVQEEEQYTPNHGNFQGLSVGVQRDPFGTYDASEAITSTMCASDMNANDCVNLKANANLSTNGLFPSAQSGVGNASALFASPGPTAVGIVENGRTDTKQESDAGKDLDVEVCAPSVEGDAHRLSTIQSLPQSHTNVQPPMHILQEKPIVKLPSASSLFSNNPISLPSQTPTNTLMHVDLPPDELQSISMPMKTNASGADNPDVGSASGGPPSMIRHGTSAVEYTFTSEQADSEFGRDKDVYIEETNTNNNSSSNNINSTKSNICQPLLQSTTKSESPASKKPSLAALEGVEVTKKNQYSLSVNSNAERENSHHEDNPQDVSMNAQGDIHTPVPVVGYSDESQLNMVYRDDGYESNLDSPAKMYSNDKHSSDVNTYAREMDAHTAYHGSADCTDGQVEGIQYIHEYSKPKPYTDQIYKEERGTDAGTDEQSVHGDKSYYTEGQGEYGNGTYVSEGKVDIHADQRTDQNNGEWQARRDQDIQFQGQHSNNDDVHDDNGSDRLVNGDENVDVQSEQMPYEEYHGYHDDAGEYVGDEVGHDYDVAVNACTQNTYNDQYMGYDEGEIEYEDEYVDDYDNGSLDDGSVDAFEGLHAFLEKPIITENIPDGFEFESSYGEMNASVLKPSVPVLHEDAELLDARPSYSHDNGVDVEQSEQASFMQEQNNRPLQVKGSFGEPRDLLQRTTHETFPEANIGSANPAMLNSNVLTIKPTQSVHASAPPVITTPVKNLSVPTKSENMTDGTSHGNDGGSSPQATKKGWLTSLSEWLPKRTASGYTGEELSMYYDPVKKKWINPNESEEEDDEPPPPPPTALGFGPQSGTTNSVGDGNLASTGGIPEGPCAAATPNANMFSAGLGRKKNTRSRYVDPFAK